MMTDFDVTLETLPYVLKLIDGVGVYAFKNAEGKYIYIGKSVKLRNRMNRHHLWLRKLIAEYGMSSIGIVHCDLNELDDLEKRAVEYHKPFFNDEYNSKRNYQEIKVKVPHFLAFKLKEVVAQTDERDVSLLAAEGFEYLIRKYTYGNKEKSATTVL